MAKRTRTRLIGLGAALAVVLTVVGMSVVRADPNPDLAPVTPAELLASTLGASARPVSVSGEVTTRVDLGLPELPASLGGGELGPVSALLGSQRYKVWRSPDGLRVAHLVELGEQILVANRTEAWLWESDGMKAEHLVYADLAPAGGDQGAWFAGAGAGTAYDGRRLDPSVMAPMALAALAPYAEATVDGTARVAGRPAYELVLTPRSPLTLIGSIAVAVDAETRLPLRLQIMAKGDAEPPIEIGFTSVSFDPIDPSVFTFTPPVGADVSTPDRPEPPTRRDGADVPDDAPDPTVRTFGSGFDTRVAVRLDTDLPAEASALLPYAGPLASVLPVDVSGHTWLLVGFVSLDTLRGDADRLA